VAYKKTEDVDEYAPRGGARKKKGKASAAATANKENAEIVAEKKVVAAVSNVHVLLKLSIPQICTLTLTFSMLRIHEYW
jgi:hypothetical protein